MLVLGPQHGQPSCCRCRHAYACPVLGAKRERLAARMYGQMPLDTFNIAVCNVLTAPGEVAGVGKTGMPPACGAITVASMDVTFTKVAGRRYLMTVVRERGPQLAPRHGPGYDDYLPHDAVHFLVEAEARLASGVFGQIAAGQSNIFWAADPKGLRRQARREAKRIPSAAERADMGRSEDLAGCCQPLWELRAGHRRELPLWWSSVTPDMLELLESPLCERILARLDEFAARRHALPVGRSVTLSWPLDGQGRVVRR